MGSEGIQRVEMDCFYGVGGGRLITRFSRSSTSVAINGSRIGDRASDSKPQPQSKPEQCILDRADQGANRPERDSRGNPLSSVETSRTKPEQAKARGPLAPFRGPQFETEYNVTDGFAL